MNNFKLTRRNALLSGAAAALLPSAFAQPADTGKVVKLVVGFPAGQATDLVSRVLAERMRAAIGASPFKGERAMIAMTASFGVTTIRADDSTVSLFKRADDALQAAKAGGRNRVVEAAMPAAPAA